MTQEKRRRKSHKHRTVDQRIAQQQAKFKEYGVDPKRNTEMLELFLGGDSVRDIAEAYGIKEGSVYNAIAKEALFRLLKQRAADHLEEIDEIVKGSLL